MTLDEVMKQERQALLSEYLYLEGEFGKTNVPPYCAVSDVRDLQQTPTGLRKKHPVKIEELPSSPKESPGFRSGDALVQNCSSLSYKFLWVHVDNDHYRNDYTTFLKTCHSIRLQTLPKNYHVDHLFNRERARIMNLRFIRTILLPGTINTSLGAGYEKSRTNSAIGSRGGRPRGIDEILLMKVCGLRSPRKGMPISAEAHEYAQRAAALFGIPAAELERNIRELMQVANYRWTAPNR